MLIDILGTSALNIYFVDAGGNRDYIGRGGKRLTGTQRQPVLTNRRMRAVSTADARDWSAHVCVLLA